MCWSLGSSRNAYIIGTIASLILLYYGDNVDKNIGSFFLAVAQIQLIEYFIWKDQSCGSMNHYASRMIVPVLVLQAIAMIGGGYLFSSTILTHAQIKTFFTLVFTLGSVIAGYNLYKTFNDKLCSKKMTDRGILWASGNAGIIKDSGRLITIWNIFYFGSLFLFPLLWKSNLKKYLGLFLGISALLIIRYLNRITWESRWCFPSAFMPVLFIFIMLLQRYRWIPSNI
jgi:hypothetical protein